MKEFKSRKIINLNAEEMNPIKGGEDSVSVVVTSSEPCIILTITVTHELTLWNSPQQGMDEVVGVTNN